MKKKGLLAVALLVGIGGALAFFQMKKKPPPVVQKEELKAQWGELHAPEEIASLIEGFGIKKVVDFPGKTPPDGALGSEIEYLGLHPEKQAIDHWRIQKYQPGVTFAVHELSTDPLPEADLLILWDCLNTLSPSAIRSSLMQVKKSGTKFVLLCDFPDVEKNHKSHHGEFQKIGWEKPPYNFPAPLLRLKERQLALWQVDQLS